ncbi:isochorismatase family cysteine hydrolase [Thiomicrorhabdus sp.]|uniref:cysteine hydrolase family protein n=1 Tax=Thiomicrorhabdus sp. TaxID=2039724 RepID=UPI0029C8C29D|nr:isochorismatase family cysteine hydrolase [Thiomicrorhabdus sp.]
MIRLQFNLSVPYAWPLSGELNLEKTALIVIDMQRDFLEDGGYFASMGEDISDVQKAIQPAKAFLETARHLRILVIHTRESHRENLSDLNANKFIKSQNQGASIGSEGPMGRLLIRGEYGCDIIDDLKPLEEETVIDKPGNSAFYATDMETILRAQNIENLILLGVTTDVCVSSTMRDANDRGFDCLILEDCCGAANRELHRSVFNSMEREGGIFGSYANSADFSHFLLEARREIV